MIDPDTRVSLILGGFDGSFQIPNNPGQATLGYNVNGVTSFNSAALNEKQTEMTVFAVLSLQKHIDDKDVQISLFNRTSTLHFSPDWVGDLLFNGIAQQASRQDVATGMQGDGSWRINDAQRCAPASWRRSSRPAPTPRRACCRWTRPGCRPPSSR